MLPFFVIHMLSKFISLCALAFGMIFYFLFFPCRGSEQNRTLDYLNLIFHLYISYEFLKCYARVFYD